MENAKKINHNSEFGRRMDSLADIVISASLPRALFHTIATPSILNFFASYPFSTLGAYR